MPSGRIRRQSQAAPVTSRQQSRLFIHVAHVTKFRPIRRVNLGRFCEIPGFEVENPGRRRENGRRQEYAGAALGFVFGNREELHGRAAT